MALLESAPAASLLESVPALLAEDMFGKTFLAGMSIALSSVVTTAFVGFIVRGRYDQIEAHSMSQAIATNGGLPTRTGPSWLCLPRRPPSSRPKKMP